MEPHSSDLSCLGVNCISCFVVHSHDHNLSFPNKGKEDWSNFIVLSVTRPPLACLLPASFPLLLHKEIFLNFYHPLHKLNFLLIYIFLHVHSPGSIFHTAFPVYRMALCSYTSILFFFTVT